jgi:superfamily II DNA or RNA helicase
MSSLESLKRGAQVKGIHPSGAVTVLDVDWHGKDVVELTYRDGRGNPGNILLYREQEANLEVLEQGIPWAFDSDGHLFRLVSEAYRIRMAYLFDPWLAVHLSQIEPLPHQITAVYGEMLPRQPLRFLLADDPGAGKTVMTGLFIKELMLRGDLERCLIVAPGNLTEQWQDELSQKFHLPFELLTNDRLEAARSGNALQEMNLVIARLDKLSRDEELQERLKRTEWDLIVVDEAHKMSASLFGNEIKYTGRYKLGKLLSEHTRHFLLLTATPHNGKEADFQLFMALLDEDRFEGKYREGVHETDVSDLIRRLVKEQLLRFDGSRLFPERRAYTVAYHLSEPEESLYHEVTNYVREEFNRAENLDKDRKGTVGFALTVLQRRLASSPEAIYQSLHRRRERLESRLRELKLLKRGAETPVEWDAPEVEFEDYLDDLEDAPEEEAVQATEQVLDLATTARTIGELELEIQQLRELEALADQVRHSNQDRKWQELSRILQDEKEMFDVDGQRPKLVIFTEHRDTLNYLAEKIRSVIGKPEAVAVIHGGMSREARRAMQAAFVQVKDVLILLATDAAGEGINLQRAHLMVNYDLPWNPARIEQRFGRIHRIGQKEVCHLWNLLAEETREGDVYIRLLRKIEEQRKALGDRVFDVLGNMFRETSLRELLLDAVRYGDQPEVRARLYEKVDNLAERKHVQELLDEHALARDALDLAQVQKIRADFERAQARRLQPHFIATFFRAAFEYLKGSMHARETNRFEITHVPAEIRNRARSLGNGVVLSKYERITFHKEAISLPGKPLAEFISPGQPLMEAIIDLLLEKAQDVLKRGAILVDPKDDGDQARALFYVEHAIQDGVTERAGNRRVISRRMLFAEMNAAGDVQSAGPAPFLDYEPLPPEMYAPARQSLSADWLTRDLESGARSFAIRELVPGHLQEVKARRDESVTRTRAAVHARLTSEILYWDRRAQDLKAKEQAGKVNARLNSDLAQRRADDLQMRLRRRMDELDQELQLAPQPPVILGGALVIPAGLLRRLAGQTHDRPGLFGDQRDAVEQAAMQAVITNEETLGNQPVDVSSAKVGYDVESRLPSGKLKFIEVKGRAAGAETVTVTKREILTCLNKPQDFFLAVVEVDFVDEKAIARKPIYILNPFRREPDFGAVSVNYEWKELLKGI